MRRCSLWIGLLWIAAATGARAWDYEGHRLVNRIALASLPTNFPAFVFTAAARERIAFLAGEPDRWRNTPDQALRHANNPDHFIDLDLLADYDLTLTNVSPFRHEYTVQLWRGRQANPGRFPAINPDTDADRTKALIGYLPWAITENYARVKSGFSSLKTFEQFGRPDEMENARQNLIYVMGVMGHYVGDAAQPLHTTRHHNGWVGANPHRYTTNRSFHSWIDGGFLSRVGVKFEDLAPQVRPAKFLWDTDPRLPRTNAFPVVMEYIAAQHQYVEQLYRMDQEQKLHPGDPRAAEGREFLMGQLLKAGQMLGDLWYSAWLQAGPDTFLQSQLVKRQAAEAGTNAPARGNSRSGSRSRGATPANP